MSKYKNKDGVELNYSGNDIQSTLTKEVISEAIKIINMYDRSCKISMGMAMNNTKKFLRSNFGGWTPGDDLLRLVPGTVSKVGGSKPCVVSILRKPERCAPHWD